MFPIKLLFYWGWLPHLISTVKINKSAFKTIIFFFELYNNGQHIIYFFEDWLFDWLVIWAFLPPSNSDIFGDGGGEYIYLNPQIRQKVN